MYYVYLLQSLHSPDKTYIGYTINISQRLADHNSGKSFHTEKYRPWEMVSYVAFNSQEKALDFERYLKSGSGRAFALRHFR